MNMRRYRGRAAVALFCLVLLLMSAVVAGAEPESQVLLGTQTAVEGAITITSRVTLSPGGETRIDGGDEGVWLTGLSTQPDAVPQVLALSWSPISSGWFGAMWGVQLYSQVGLIPNDLHPRNGADFLADSEFLALSSSLVWGNEYESMLSYDPKTGAASVVITEVSTGKKVVSQGFQLAPYDGTVYPVAGYKVDENAGAVIELAKVNTLEVKDVFVPAGVLWYWVQAPANSDNYDTVGELDRRNKSGIAVELPWSNVPGYLRVVQEVGPGQDAVLATVNELTGNLVVPFSTANMSVGVLRVRPELVVGTEVWPQETKQTMYGVVRMRVESIEPRTSSNGTKTLEGRLYVQTDGAVPGAMAQVTVNLTQYDETVVSNPLQNATVLSFDLGQVGLAENLTIPFRVQLPPADPSSPDRWWLAHIEASVSPNSLGVRTLSQDWVVSPIITTQVQLAQ